MASDADESQRDKQDDGWFQYGRSCRRRWRQAKLPLPEEQIGRADRAIVVGIALAVCGSAGHPETRFPEGTIGGRGIQVSIEVGA